MVNLLKYYKSGKQTDSLQKKKQRHYFKRSSSFYRYRAETKINSRTKNLLDKEKKEREKFVDATQKITNGPQNVNFLILIKEISVGNGKSFY
jgi:hypothetical protein